MKQIQKEDVEKYIDGYFKKKYQVETETQPHFWEAVTKLVLDPESYVGDLINEEEGADFCIRAEKLRKNLYTYHSVAIFSTNQIKITTVYDLAKYIADQIIQVENTPISNVDFFLLEKRVLDIEEALHWY